MEYVILFLAVALIIVAFIPSDSDSHAVKFITLLATLGCFAGSIYTDSYDSGIKDGAYNQLGGKYEVTYVVDKDSCVIDTIINFK